MILVLHASSRFLSKTAQMQRHPLCKACVIKDLAGKLVALRPITPPLSCPNPAVRTMPPAAKLMRGHKTRVA
jgi:hypothetical protein